MCSLFASCIFIWTNKDDDDDDDVDLEAMPTSIFLTDDDDDYTSFALLRYVRYRFRRAYLLSGSPF